MKKGITTLSIIISIFVFGFLLTPQKSEAGFSLVLSPFGVSVNTGCGSNCNSSLYPPSPFSYGNSYYGGYSGGYSDYGYGNSYYSGYSTYPVYPSYYRGYGNSYTMYNDYYNGYGRGSICMTYSC